MGLLLYSIKMLIDMINERYKERKLEDQLKLDGADCQMPLLHNHLKSLEILRNRSCSEVGIDPNLCACLTWKNVTQANPFYDRVGNARVSKINDETDPVRKSIREYMERKLEEQLKLDKGTGCQMPILDPFSKDITKFDTHMDKVTCRGLDWVKCYLSECKVVQVMLDTHDDVKCEYEDIVYVNDVHYDIGMAVTVVGSNVYHLIASDYARVSCSAKSKGIKSMPGQSNQWSGVVAGFRSSPPRPNGGNAINVLIFAFDSTSRNGFIRYMPHSYMYLMEELNAELLKGYNILGDGTPAALFPILTGKNEFELPDARKTLMNNNSMSDMPFIFFMLKEKGYRTLYFEDMPRGGTFQYRFNGFRSQPADHYLMSFLLEQENRERSWWKYTDKYCVGDTPQYKLMMNLTNQFFHQDGKKFALTFIAGITHDDFNLKTADDDFVEFLKTFKKDGFLENTMLLVMGDHGPRFSDVRKTFQGKIEERLPFMAIVLPSSLKSQRPQVVDALRQNADVLTTPHDIHSTILDAMDLREYSNPYKIKGADLPRAMSLFEPIPRNRSCSEAGIAPHWCACFIWENVTQADPFYDRVVNELVSYINDETEPVRSKCTPRTLSSVSWVMRLQVGSGLLSFEGARDLDCYILKFGKKVKVTMETYQVKLTVDPGAGDFEASISYLAYEDTFHVDGRDISRTNRYGNEPDCISKTHPHLNPYCYCAN